MEHSRAAGGILGLAAFGTVVAMALHPSDAHAAGLAVGVHATMIGLLLTMGWGFLQFAAIRGAWRPWVSAGLVAYAGSILAHVLAGTINGFAVPALINPEAPVSHDIFRFAWFLNQALAKVGMMAASAAYILWSVDLLRAGERRQLMLGASGLVVGLAVPALLVSAVATLNVHGALLLYGLQALWAMVVGAAMFRGRI